MTAVKEAGATSVSSSWQETGCWQSLRPNDSHRLRNRGLAGDILQLPFSTTKRFGSTPVSPVLLLGINPQRAAAQSKTRGTDLRDEGPREHRQGQSRVWWELLCRTHFLCPLCNTTTSTRKAIRCYRRKKEVKVMQLMCFMSSHSQHFCLTLNSSNSHQTTQIPPHV